jgi:DNA-binding response OmpR family regulator
MLYFRRGMPVVFVIARDWTLRTAVRAELREQGVEALGMESADAAGRALAEGQVPSAVVIEALSEIAGDPGIQKLMQRVPAILVASRTETVPLPRVAAVFYRPVRIADIVARVREIVTQGHAA